MLGKEPLVVPADKALAEFKERSVWKPLCAVVCKERLRSKRIEALEFAFNAGWHARDRPKHTGIKQGGYYRLSEDEFQTQLQLIKVAVDEAVKRDTLDSVIMTAIEMVRTNPQMSAAEAVLSEVLCWSGKKA